MKYTFGGVVRYDSVGYISDALIGETTGSFNYKSFVNSTERGVFAANEIQVEVSEETNALLLNHTPDIDLKYKNSVFNYFLEGI